MSKRVTQKTVADALGLSPSTVGLVLGSCATRGSKKLSPDTEERIRAKAVELGYQPDRAAQLVRSGRSNQIALIHFGGVSEVGSAANRAIAAEIVRQGYQCLTVDMSWHGQDFERPLNELVQARVEGVVISLITEAFRKEHVAIFAKAGIPVISVNGDPRIGVPLICDDVEDAFYRLTRHALEQGHRKLLLVVHDVLNRPTTGRMQGFRRALEGEGVVECVPGTEIAARWPALRKRRGVVGCIAQLPMLPEHHAFQHAVYAFAQRLFCEKAAPDIFLATNDVAAFGVHAAALECGLRIPEDVALSGYGNYDFGRYPAYSLTTVDPCVSRSAVEAVRQLVSRLRKENGAMRSRQFPAELLLRRSSQS